MVKPEYMVTMHTYTDRNGPIGRYKILLHEKYI